jgi:hypothetical protein
MTHALDIPSYYESEITRLRGNVPLEQFVLGAVIEKIASLNTSDFLAKKAKNGTIDDGLSVLQKANDIAPEEFDRL